MKTLSIIALIISIVAIVLVVVVALNQEQPQQNITPIENVVLDSTAQSLSSDITVIQSRLGGNNALEVRRQSLTTFYGDTELGAAGLDVVDYFDLALRDQQAADQLRPTLEAPTIVRPFQPFTIKWRVAGSSTALERVNSYQMNIGPKVNYPLPYNDVFNQNGSSVVGLPVITSIPKSHDIDLWARFGTGIHELATHTVQINYAGCETSPFSLSQMGLELYVAATVNFIDGVEEAAGEGATVTVLETPIQQNMVSQNGFRVTLKLRLDTPDGSADVDFDMQFNLVPTETGDLEASFFSPGYKSIDIRPDIPWYGKLWYFITLGEYNVGELYRRFGNGLDELASGYAAYQSNQIRSSFGQDPAPGIVGASINSNENNFNVMTCPIGGDLYSVVGTVPQTMLLFDIEDDVN